MKRIFLFLISVIALVISGCYEDKGNYDYRESSQPSVKGIEGTYNVYMGDQLVIKPEVAWSGEEMQNVSYAWRIENELISEEKDLDVVVGGIPVRSGLYGEFVIKNEDTGIEYLTLFRVNAKSAFSSGWLLLADEEDHSVLSYVRDDGELYSDIYKMMNHAELSGGGYALSEHWLFTSDEIGQVFVACQKGPEYSVELDGNSFIKMVATRDEFVGGAPANFKPMGMKCVYNYDYLMSDGKLYVRYVDNPHSAQYQDGFFPNFPYPGDYELSGMMLRGNIIVSNEIICFDKKSSSYVLLQDGELKEFDYVNDAQKRFKPSNMDKRVLDGGAIKTESPTDVFLTILKGNHDGKAYIHQFQYDGYRTRKYTSLAETEFPDASIINDDSKFAVCLNRPYVYIASGNVLYVYNYEDNVVEPLRSDFGRKILDIAICGTDSQRLGVVLENATDASKSDFMELDVSVVAGGATVEGMEFVGKFGRVKDLIYKIGDQWNTY